MSYNIYPNPHTDLHRDFLGPSQKGPVQQLWRHVVRRADPEGNRALQVLGQPKVDDLEEVAAPLDHAVLWLEVPVAVTVFVHVADLQAVKLLQ